MKLAFAALAVAAMLSAPASATTLGTIGPGNDGLAPLDLPNPLKGIYGADIILGIATNIRVTILGSEAGYVNTFKFGSGSYSTGGNTNSFFNTGAGNNDYLGTGIFSWVVSNVAPGLLNFWFDVNGGAGSVANGSNVDGSLAVNDFKPNFFASFLPGFSGSGGSSVLLFLDDGGGGSDDNHDDLIVRLDIAAVPAAVPVPAAGFLLAGALGGLAALRRRKALAA